MKWVDTNVLYDEKSFTNINKYCMSTKLALLFDEDLHKKFYIENVQSMDSKLWEIRKSIPENLTDTDKHNIEDLIMRLRNHAYELEKYLIFS